MPAAAIPTKVPTTLAAEYKERIVPALIASRGYKNVMEVPKIQKVVVNCCIGSSVDTKVALEDAFNEIQMITGQKPIKTKSTKSIANFKLRENQEIGVKVTLRGPIMYEFLERLIRTALPRIRDFRGVSPAPSTAAATTRSASRTRPSSPRSSSTKSSAPSAWTSPSSPPPARTTKPRSFSPSSACPSPTAS